MVPSEVYMNAASFPTCETLRLWIGGLLGPQTFIDDLGKQRSTFLQIGPLIVHLRGCDAQKRFIHQFTTTSFIQCRLCFTLWVSVLSRSILETVICGHKKQHAQCKQVNEGWTAAPSLWCIVFGFKWLDHSQQFGILSCVYISWRQVEATSTSRPPCPVMCTCKYATRQSIVWVVVHGGTICRVRAFGLLVLHRGRSAYELHWNLVCFEFWGWCFCSQNLPMRKNKSPYKIVKTTLLITTM